MAPSTARTNRPRCSSAFRRGRDSLGSAMEELNMLKMETEATQRISACRAKIQQAAANAEQSAEFEERIIQFYTAAGRGESDATTLAAEVRAYIEAVPDLLERLLQSVREPGVPDAWVTKRMAI